MRNSTRKGDDRLVTEPAESKDDTPEALENVSEEIAPIDPVLDSKLDAMDGSPAPIPAKRKSISWWTPVSKIFAVVGGFVLVLGGLLIASRSAQDSLAEDPGFSIPFAEIECNAPPGSDRLTFLVEVWYLAEASPRVNLLDRHLRETLETALSKHPRVERLEALEVTPDRRLRLGIRYRNL